LKTIIQESNFPIENVKAQCLRFLDILIALTFVQNFIHRQFNDIPLEDINRVLDVLSVEKFEGGYDFSRLCKLLQQIKVMKQDPVNNEKIINVDYSIAINYFVHYIFRRIFNMKKLNDFFKIFNEKGTLLASSHHVLSGSIEFLANNNFIYKP
jgi:hypothetical protein